MRTLTHCSNPAEASFLQSLLHEQGIEAFIPDQNLVPIGTYQIPLQVDPVDFERASIIIADFTAAQNPATTNAEPPTDKHPGDGFPFLGIMGLVACIYIIAVTVRTLCFASPDQSLIDLFTNAIAMGVASILKGLFAGCVVSFLCLIARPLWRHLKKD